jgi:hypothetical protein
VCAHLGLSSVSALRSWCNLTSFGLSIYSYKMLPGQCCSKPHWAVYFVLYLFEVFFLFFGLDHFTFFFFFLFVFCQTKKFPTPSCCCFSLVTYTTLPPYFSLLSFAILIDSNSRRFLFSSNLAPHLYLCTDISSFFLFFFLFKSHFVLTT